jgi:hypothetical protein
MKLLYTSYSHATFHPTDSSPTGIKCVWPGRYLEMSFKVRLAACCSYRYALFESSFSSTTKSFRTILATLWTSLLYSSCSRSNVRVLSLPIRQSDWSRSLLEIEPFGFRGGYSRPVAAYCRSMIRKVAMSGPKTQMLEQWSMRQTNSDGRSFELLRSQAFGGTSALSDRHRGFVTQY